MYYILLINQAIQLGYESHKLGNTMPVVFILQNRSRQLLVDVEERGLRREFVTVHFQIVIVHKLPIEIVRVIQF